MSDRIIITGVSAIGFHGVYPDELKNGQLFIVDAILNLDLSVPGSNDQLINTVDYAKVSQLIQKLIVGEPHLLIESLAQSIADQILAAYSLIRKVAVTVHKPNADVGVTVSDIAVEIERSQ